MKLSLLLLSSVILLSGCVSRVSVLKPPANTLIGNDRLPHEEMGRLSQPSQWELIRDLEYSGYAIMEGRVDDDGQVRVTRMVERYPDDSRNQLAYALGNTVVIHAATIGTKMGPKALVYIVFYEKLSGRNLAFIFAKQVDFSAPGVSGVASYLNTVTY